MSGRKKTTPNKPRLPKEPPRPVQMAAQELPPAADDVTPIVDFLMLFQQLADPRAQMPSKLISLKVPVPLLEAFRFKAAHHGLPYQTVIKRLMKAWLATADASPPA